MQKKYLKIIGCLFFFPVMVMGLYLSIFQKPDWSILMMEENVEALTSPETEDSDPDCIKARGYCLVRGVRRNGILLIN